MNPAPKPKRYQFWITASLGAALIVAFLLVKGHPQVSPPKNAPSDNAAGWTNQIVPPAVAATSSAKQPSWAATNTGVVVPAAVAPKQNFSWFQARPFKVAESNAVYEWTAEDGRDTNVILRLAHNELEYARMVAENNTIFRRQLVYHAEGFTLLAQRALQTGQSIDKLTLPGLDGATLPVVITKTDFESGGDRGLFYGKLPGRPDSMVTVAFMAAREAFSVISPQDQIFLQAEAREPGELIINSIDPKTYGGHAD